MAARSMWTGSISFGLVNIPVKLYPAVHEQGIAFHMLHDQDSVRLQRKMVCPADGQEVHPEHIVKGYEIAPDRYVVVLQEEIDAVAPEASRSIEIRDFVDLANIDPVYYDRPYYLAPGEHAAKAYRLLVDAMTATKKVGIAKLVMRGTEYLVAIRPVDGSLCLQTMHFGEEVEAPGDVPGLPVEVGVQDRELKVAQQLVESLAGKFDPKKYHNEYLKRLQEMVERKSQGEEIHTQPQVTEKRGRVVDLMSALEASLAQARGEAREGGKATKTAARAAAASHKGESKRQQTRRGKSA